MDYLKSAYGVAERRACRLVAISRSVYQYRSHRDPQTALRQRMCEIAATRMRYGYRKIRVLLLREGYQVSKNRLYRLYREEGLSVRYRPNRKRRAQMSRPARAKSTAANQAWSLDFVADQLSNGQRFRALTIIDVFTREALAQFQWSRWFKFRKPIFEARTESLFQDPHHQAGQPRYLRTPFNSARQMIC